MDRFNKLDLDQVLEIEFLVLSKNSNIKGKFQIDEMAFFGFNEIAFESHRDNLVGFPKRIIDQDRVDKLRRKRGDDLLKEIAKDTWKYFENARDKETNLIVDHIRVGDGPLAADYTSPTNIAMDLLAIISAHDLDFISRDEALTRVKGVIDTLKKMRRFEGFFLQFL